MGYNVDFVLERDVPELTGKVVLITGGTGGLGAGAALLLAKRNPAKLYITGRNEAATQKIIKQIHDDGSSTEVTFLPCDQSSLASVKQAADTFLVRESRLDVLMANAGVMAAPPGLTEDGYEVQFGVNHVAHALLIRKLLPLLDQTAITHGDARIVMLTSLAFILAPRGHGIVFDELRTPQNYWFLGGFQRYAQSKLANLLHGRELARRYPNITTIVIHPGESNTSLVGNLSWYHKIVVFLPNIGRFLPVEQGCWNQVWAVGVPKDKVVSGEMYEPIGALTKGYTQYCLDEKLAARLWDWTDEELKAWL
ncbi:oxidoreductase [Podospora appendiculata]|uniref:Oxidoreductase n=1 Tax=Podospora appendiculata TaxID=314037 RepID=A0AAE0X3X1_9PEZI|nr:oxidoreductase [Podospora appendiculata]